MWIDEVNENKKLLQQIHQIEALTKYRGDVYEKLQNLELGNRTSSFWIELATSVKKELVEFAVELEIPWEEHWLKEFDVDDAVSAIRFLEVVVEEIRPKQARQFFDKANEIVGSKLPAVVPKPITRTTIDT